MQINERTIKLLEELNKDVFEKEEVIALSFLTAIAGESIFLLGTPGVAKSLIARRLKFAFKSDKAFEYLMNRFSTPDEIFGPVSISKLKNEDKYQRVTKHYLPDANVVFLDEIWKAGPSIQNTLLTIINEKIYRNGEFEQKVDIRGLISASNELPEQGQGLEALWDRFIIRYFVDSIVNSENFNAMISKSLKSYYDTVNPELKISDDEYKEWSDLVDLIEIPNEVFNVIQVIRGYLSELKGENYIYISDRRWRKIVRILRTSAYLNNRNEVDLMDCFLIAHCIWNKPEQLEKVKELVANAIHLHGYSINLETKNIGNEILEFDKEVKRDTFFRKSYFEEEPKTFDKDYIEVKNLENKYGYNRILKNDFEVLTENQRTVYLYDNNNVQRKQVYIKKKDKFTISVKHDYYHDDFEVITHKVEKFQDTTRKPNQRLIKQWDEVVNEIRNTISVEIDKLNDFKVKSMSFINSNIFVDKRLGVVITENINAEERNLQQLILDIEKIKHYYDGLE